ncbi:MAG TPA: Rieske 2Fe-2S domain-containing protein [Mycobacteriales bacterium]|nr:Rieske 2Fe-2S domain-containing protein [Mycobacteriales bacterium]
MSDSIRDRLKATGEDAEPAAPVAHGEHPVGDPTTSTHHSYHGVLDAHSAKRAELAVSGLFLLAVVGVLGFIATFAFWPFEFGDRYYEWYTPLLGTTMALALLGLGAGAILWAKTLMVDEETVQERHLLSSAEEDKEGAVAILKEGAADAGLGKYPLLRRSFLLANGALGLLIVPFLFGMGRFQFKEDTMAKTGWRKGSRLLDELGRPVKLGDLEVGGVKSVFPDVHGGRRMADSAAIIIRMRPDVLKTRDSRRDWVVDGHVAYSVICTHLGCPVKLYEQQTHHLFCPCHQSTFDAADGAKVLFGPAARNLPQLAIAVDDEGYFVAQGDFNEPVGPSYWERKPHYKDEVK